jgi:hypothetical protein
VNDSVSVKQLLAAIRKLPSDEPVDNPKAWYRTQKEHWIGWLSEYSGPGAYGRKVGVPRDARWAYNHIVCSDMLLWLIEATGVSEDLVSQAKRDSASGTTLMEQSGIIRRIVPWPVIAAALWDGSVTSRSNDLVKLIQRLLRR